MSVPPRSDRRVPPRRLPPRVLEGIRVTEAPFSAGPLSFHVPDGWVYESEEPETLVFSHPEIDLGTIRVSYLRFSAPENREVSADTVLDLTRAQGARDAAVLSSGNVLWREQGDSVQEGEAITTWHWHVARAFPPDQVGIAILSLTILKQDAGSDMSLALVALVEESARQLEFH